MKILIAIILDNKTELSKIDGFSEGLSPKLDDFSSIKKGYRNTVGKVYEEVHKKIPEGSKRAQMKFKVFCCHLINRIFKVSVKR